MPVNASMVWWATKLTKTAHWAEGFGFVDLRLQFFWWEVLRGPRHLYVYAKYITYNAAYRIYYFILHFV